MNELVRLRPSIGRLRYLLRASRERCPDCSRGTRTLTVWVTAAGEGEEVAWCSHCFNATCEPVALDEEHRVRFQTVRTAIARKRTARTWAAARPALEDLERRGLF